MPNIGMGELVVVLLIVVLVFGANRLPQLGESVGKAIKNFKRGINTDDDIEVEAKPKASKRVAASSTASKLGDAEDAEDVEEAEPVKRKNG